MNKYIVEIGYVIGDPEEGMYRLLSQHIEEVTDEKELIAKYKDLQIKLSNWYKDNQSGMYCPFINLHPIVQKSEEEIFKFLNDLAEYGED